MAVAVIVVLILVVAVVAVVAMRRRTADPVDSFRRQIDALSPEARRPTLDQIKSDDEPAPDEDVVEPQDDGADDGEADPDGT